MRAMINTGCGTRHSAGPDTDQWELWRESERRKRKKARRWKHRARHWHSAARGETGRRFPQSFLSPTRRRRRSQLTMLGKHCCCCWTWSGQLDNAWTLQQWYNRRYRKSIIKLSVPMWAACGLCSLSYIMIFQFLMVIGQCPMSNGHSWFRRLQLLELKLLLL